MTIIILNFTHNTLSANKNEDVQYYSKQQQRSYHIITMQQQFDKRELRESDTVTTKWMCYYNIIMLFSPS